MRAIPPKYHRPRKGKRVANGRWSNIRKRGRMRRDQVLQRRLGPRNELQKRAGAEKREGGAPSPTAVICGDPNAERVLATTRQKVPLAELGIERVKIKKAMTRSMILEAPHVMVCYADDTLVLAGGRWWHETLRHGELAAACVIRAIRRLGLRMSPAKSGTI